MTHDPGAIITSWILLVLILSLFYVIIRNVKDTKF